MVKKTKKSTKSTKSKTTKPVQQVAPPVEEKKEVTLSDAFSDLLGQLASLRTQLTAVTSQARQLSKRSERELRAAQKASRKRPRKSGTRAPSGFVKPTLISSELAKFVGVPDGTLMARTEVTKQINCYIKEHKLQDPSNGRIIIPDATLGKLLNIKKDEQLTFFNLQKYMSPHFAKAGSTTFA